MAEEQKLLKWRTNYYSFVSAVSKLLDKYKNVRGLRKYRGKIPDWIEFTEDEKDFLDRLCLSDEDFCNALKEFYYILNEIATGLLEGHEISPHYIYTMGTHYGHIEHVLQGLSSPYEWDLPKEILNNMYIAMSETANISKILEQHFEAEKR